MENIEWPDDTHFFSDLRVHQLRKAQQHVIAEAGLRSIDFGQIFEGWQARQNKVHPLPLPGVFAYYWPLLEAIHLEHLSEHQSK